MISVPSFGATRDATIPTTLTVTNANGTLGASGVAFSGPATLTNIGNGSFSGTLPIVPTGGNLVGTFSITLTSGDRINVTLTVPAGVLTGAPLTGSATVTGGTGVYAGATGSFPNLTGTTVIGFTTTLSITGPGTIVTGGAVGPTAPTITEVLNGASVEGDLAQGSIFVVKGTTLSASGFTESGLPRPTTLGGVKITFTPQSGGAGTDAFMVYLFNLNGVNQLAAILPSAVPVGNYNLTVTNNGTSSAPFPIKVVQRRVSVITADSSGSGLAVVQNFISPSQLDINRLTTFASGGFTFSPSKPGQTLILYAVGLGAVTGGDDIAGGAFDFAANGVDVQALVGGVPIRAAFAGRTRGTGADQINFTLPANIPTGCTVSFQLSVNGVRSKPTFIAIAPDANASACVQPGFTTSQLQQFDQGGSFTVGSFALTQISQTVPSVGSVKINSAAGQFIRYSGLQLAGLSQAQAQTSTTGGCYIVPASTDSAEVIPTGNLVGLDAGNVTLNGPAASNISNRAFTQDAKSKFYSLSLATEGIPILGAVGTIVGGTYTLAGAGGKDVGGFNGSLTLGSPLTITGGLPSTVNRATGLTLSWTGGNASDLVQIVGNSSSGQISGTFVCTTTAGTGGFTVPSSILTQLPVSTVTSGVPNGYLSVLSGATSTFTAPLVAGGSLDAGAFVGFIGTGTTPAYQ